MALYKGCKMSAQTDQKECEGYKEYNAGMNMLFQAHISTAAVFPKVKRPPDAMC